MGNNNAAIELEDISISFSGVKVLHSASFSLVRNEIHAIVGKNGAGKSTFMKVLTGVYTPDSGRVFISGEEIKRGIVSRSTHKKVAMVYQDLSLIPSLSVLQNIFLSFHPYKKFGFLQDRKAREHAKKILEMVGTPYISTEQLVEDLSAGESQLVEIAKAISSEPEIIVFDEPTASLSDIEISVLFDTIGRLKKRGLSIVYITHYLGDVMKICDRVTVLRNGEVMSTNQTSQISIEKIVSDMLGEEADTESISRSTQAISDNQKPLLSITHGQTKNVGPISMHAYPGEIVGIAGLLGSGRTEILRMLYGLDPIISGSIIINGKEVAIKNPKQATLYGIRLVPEERRVQGLVLDFDIEENIAIPNLNTISSYGIIDPHKKKHIAQRMITTLQVQTTGTDQVVRFLSGGNQQKIVIAKCLVSNPKILLLDDPTFGVDIHAKTEIMKIIKDFAESGNVVIFISSEFNEIANFCNRTYIVKKRKVVNELKNILISEEDLFTHVQ